MYCQLYQNVPVLSGYVSRKRIRLSVAQRAVQTKIITIEITIIIVEALYRFKPVDASALEASNPADYLYRLIVQVALTRLPRRRIYRLYCSIPLILGCVLILQLVQISNRHIDSMYSLGRLVEIATNKIQTVTLSNTSTLSVFQTLQITGSEYKSGILRQIAIFIQRSTTPTSAFLRQRLATKTLQ